MATGNYPQLGVDVPGAGEVGQLVVTRGATAGRPLRPGRRASTSIGRHPDSDIFLDDVTVSRRHAEVRRGPDGQYVLSDVGSLNGTYLDGDRIEEAALREGAQVQVGKFRLVFVIGTLGGSRVSSGPDAAAHLSIGEVLALLQEEFPDVTISKIRFLESQGLIEPERTASGYRKFYRRRHRAAAVDPPPAARPLPAPQGHPQDARRGVDRFDPGGGAQPTLWTPTEDDAAEEDPAGESGEPAMVGARSGAATPRSSAHPAVASAGPGRSRADGPSRRPEPPAASPPGPADRGRHCGRERSRQGAGAHGCTVADR